MIVRFLHRHRVAIWTLVACAVLLALHEWSGINRWALLIPVLLATLAAMTLWERLWSRR